MQLIKIIYNGMLLSQKKRNEIFPFAATCMDLKMIVMSDVGQTEKEIFYAITYMWDLTSNTNEFIYKTYS